MTYIITLLTGEALDWASILWDQRSSLTTDSRVFISEINVFHHEASKGDVDLRFLNLSQGAQSTAEFAIEFRTLSTDSGWDQRALRATFQHALSPRLKDELAFRNPTPDLESLIDMPIRIDDHLGEHQQ